MIASGQELSAWFETPLGRYLLAWERDRFDQAVVDVFGFNALQLGLPELEALWANRMPHRWLALPESGHGAAAGQRVALVTHAAALPFPANSLDLVLLPHTLELSADPYAVLREVERVLVPEGRVVVSGLNPFSLWNLSMQRSRWCATLGLQEADSSHLFLPEAGELIGHWRLRDWLRLLNFEVDSTRFGCYRPAVRSQKWLERMAWMDRLGPRSWPIFGAVYFMVAIKRVRGMHMLGPAWKPRRSAAMPVAVAQKPSARALHQEKHQ